MATETKNIREVSWDEVAIGLQELLDDLHSVLVNIQSGFDRNNRSLALFNLGFRAARELERVSQWLFGPMDAIGWCARNLYEIELILLKVSESEDSLKRWIGQVLKDEQDIVSGFQRLRELYPPDVNERHDKMTQLISKISSELDLPIASPWSAYELAKSLGREEQYRASYKFLSKYVHPTSWIINRDEKKTNSDSYRNLLVGLVQVMIQSIQYRLQSQFGLHRQVKGRRKRAVPWMPSSYDGVLIEDIRKAYLAVKAQLDVHIQRWNIEHPQEPQDVDATALELFALSHYFVQRLDWSTWPAWLKSATRLCAAAAAIRNKGQSAPIAFNGSALSILSIVEKIKKDLGETLFDSEWLIGTNLAWPDAVNVALSVPMIDDGDIPETT